jgi:hypothetical protein
MSTALWDANVAMVRVPVTYLVHTIRKSHPSADHWLSSHEFFAAFLNEGVTRESKPQPMPTGGIWARFEKTMASLPVIMTHNIPAGEAWLMKAADKLAIAHVPESPSKFSGDGGQLEAGELEKP